MDSGDLRPLIICAAFLIFYPLLMGMVAPITEQGISEQDYTPYMNDQFDSSYLASNFIFVNQTGDVYQNMTPDLIGSYFAHSSIGGAYVTDAHDIDFTQDDVDREVHVRVIMDNSKYNPSSDDDFKKYDDFIVVHRTAGWFGDLQTDTISFNEILANYNPNLGYSSTRIKLFSYVNLNVQPEGGYSLDDVLGTGQNYSIFLSQSYIDAATGGGDAWNVIAQLLTFNFSGTGTVLDVFIATPMWISIIYLGYKAITGLIPFIGG